MNLMKLKGHGSMLGANVMWGLMSPMAKFVMVGGAVTPLVVTDLRITGAMVLFWIASFFQKPERVTPKDLLKLLGASLLAIVFNQGCFIFGVGMTSPVDASIITTSMPLLAMVLAAIYLKEPITGKKVLGIAVGATGALLLILGSHQVSEVKAAGNHYIWGDLLVLLAQLSYALYFVLFKNFVNKYSLITIMKWMFTYAAICFIPFSYRDFSAMTTMSFSATVWMEVGYVVLFGTFFAYILMLVGQKTLRPTVVSMYNYIQPIVGTTVSVFLGMGVFGWTKALAAVLIFVGVYVVTQSKSRAQMLAEGEKE